MNFTTLCYIEKENQYNEEEDKFFREQAGIIAKRLEEGKPCPVCGSIEHPNKAIKREDVLSEDELKQLEAEKNKVENKRNTIKNEIILLKEVREETGLELVNYQFRGIVTFISDKWEDEYMCLYTADKYIGEIGVCDEGELVWVEKDKIKDLNIWEGDKIFLRLLAENELFFSLKLEYQGENLINAILNGKEYN